MELRDNFVQATAERVVSANLKELKRLRRNWPGNSPTVRVTPTEGQVWQRYCYCVITPQQPISEEFWEKLENDPGWDSLSDRDRKKAPLKGFTASVLGRNDVRFASHKATLIRKGWNRDATAIAKKMRNVLAANHDSNKKAAALRECERSLASEIVRELSGCGVSHKVARLMMVWDPATGDVGKEFRYVIPLDSRWLSYLGTKGLHVTPPMLQKEVVYLQIEEALCQSCIKEGVHPAALDQIVFTRKPA